jgi:hypothetical protein
MSSKNHSREDMKRSNRTIQKRLMLSPEEDKVFTKLATDRGTDFSELTRQLLYRELKLDKSQGQGA